MSGTSKAPICSVMVPVYNGERYLAATLDSLLAQTMGDLEIVAIDDGSTDGSPDILARYQKRDPRVRFVRRENRGCVRTRNDILAMMRGEFVVINDADDLSVPDRLERQLAFFRANPEYVVVGGHIEMMDAAGRRLTTIRQPVGNDEIQDLLIRGHCCIWHSTATIRKSALDQVGGYNTRFAVGHDLEVFLRLGEVGKLTNLDYTVARYRLHAKSLGETRQLEQRALCKQACEEAWQRRGLTGLTFESGKPIRPVGDGQSKHSFNLLWGWWAFNSGEWRTALLYGAKAVASKPLNAKGWKLMACAVLKSPPKDSAATAPKAERAQSTEPVGPAEPART